MSECEYCDKKKCEDEHFGQPKKCLTCKKQKCECTSFTKFANKKVRRSGKKASPVKKPRRSGKKVRLVKKTRRSGKSARQ